MVELNIEHVKRKPRSLEKWEISKELLELFEQNSEIVASYWDSHDFKSEIYNQDVHIIIEYTIDDRKCLSETNYCSKLEFGYK